MFEWVSTWTPTLQVITSTFLSAALVYLYYKQRETLVEQTEIQNTQTKIQQRQSQTMKGQQNLQKLEYQPKILIDEWDVKSNSIELNLTNVGGGEAFDIELYVSIMPKSEIYYPDSDMDIRKYTFPLYDSSNLRESQYARVLDGNDRSIFSTHESDVISANGIGDPKMANSLGGILDDLERDYVEMVFILKYKDIFGDNHQNRFARISLELPSCEQLSFQKLLSGSPERLYMDDSVKPNCDHTPYI